WRRAVASQMIDAVLSTMAVNIDAAGQTQPYVFRATGSTIKEKGFMEVYETETKETLLPPLAENEALDLDALTPKQHFTEPPPRFTEASLVKTLEENGIGRPSTYAPTISTVVDRGYVEKEERKLKPTDLAMLVNDLLVAHFPDIVDSQFTAHMEESLDLVAEGEKDWVPVIRAFYGPFKKNLKAKEKEIDKKDVTETATKEVCDKCGKPMIIKIGRFGRFMACSGYPECRNTKPLPGSEESKVDVSGEVCPKCGAPMMVKRGRFGEFLSCSKYPECKTIKPILKKTGAKCTECKQGDIIEKKSRKGKIFFACSRYPDCTFALWSKPTGENCPTCGGLLVYAKGDMVRCSKEGCGFEKEAEKK
ncbi:topoisomerase DNA-binding C4 zinc finger domain-containing protein, partial [Candidatus Uhrbacteria bacterium]|nr:topoisomerase DNA-binding C4 zinc finger domain-containing protein [Candidatus Uhrbacteria bacterium]